jgi:hypothetical protein
MLSQLQPPPLLINYFRKVNFNVILPSALHVQLICKKQLKVKVKLKVKLSLCVSKYHAMMACRGVDLQFHVFLTPALAGGGWSALSPRRFTSGKNSPGSKRIGGWVQVRLQIQCVRYEIHNSKRIIWKFSNVSGPVFVCSKLIALQISH